MSVQTPTLPGSKIVFRGTAGLAVPASASQTVALVVTHDWGPENEVVECKSYQEFVEVFGEDATAGRTDVASCFDGAGLPGSRGAGAILVYRVVGTAGAFAKVELTNTTPVAALKLEAVHKGTRGNKLTAKVSEDVAENTKAILEVLYEGTLVSQYTYPKTNVTELAALVNADPHRWVNATELVTGVALTATAGTALAGGNNGETVTTAQLEAPLTALNLKRFSIFASRLFTTEAIQSATLAWVKERLEKSRPVRWVLGGEAAETISEAIARSTRLAHSHVINFGKGKYTDSLVAETLSTAQLAPRMAGALAAAGASQSLTFQRFGTLSVAESSSPSDQEAELAIAGGVCVLNHSLSADAEVKCEQAVSTYTSKSSAEEPYAVFSDPRLVGIMDNYTYNLKEWGDENIVGGVINSDILAGVKGKATAEQNQLEKEKLIVGGSATFEITEPAGGVVNSKTSAKQTVRYKYSWEFNPTCLHLIGEGTVSG